MPDQQQELGGPGTGTALVERPERAPTRAGGSIGLLRPIAPIKDIIEAQDETRRYIHTALKEGRDYGVIPGTSDKKKSLLKPGAERVCAAFGVTVRTEFMKEDVDHDRTTEWEKMQWDPTLRENRLRSGISKGLYRYIVRCTLWRGDILVGEGVGSCSSMEKKYVDRPRDLENTIIKMAKKRAIIDATLTTFGLSDEFSQDFDEEEENGNGDGSAESSPQQQRRAERHQSTQNTVRDQVQQAKERLGEIQQKRTKRREPSEAEIAQADEIYDRVKRVWDGAEPPPPDDHRQDDVRVALQDRDVPRMTPSGVPDVDKLGPEEMQIILEYVRGRYVKPAAPAAAPAEEPAKTEAAPEPAPAGKVDLVRLRRVGKLIHIQDLRSNTGECIGCGELLTGQRTATPTEKTADYCQKALGKIDREFKADRVPDEVLVALKGLGDLPF